MKKYYFLIIVALISGLILTGCSLLSNISQVPATEQSGITYLTKGVPGDPNVFTLYAGQDIPVGTVNAWNDASNLYVQYVVDDPWEMTCSHLYVGKTDPADFPSTPGQLPYSPGMEKSPSPNALYDDATMTYTIPLNEIYEYEFVGKGQGKGLNTMGTPSVTCDVIYIAAQAEVFRSYELVNPGAEDGMTGWDIIGPVGAVASRGESTGTVLPRSDMYFFDMTTPPADYAEMSQEVSVAGFDGTSFNANCWIQTELYPDPENANIIDNDYGKLVLTFKDGLNNVLESFPTVPIGNPVLGTGFDGYAQFSLTGNIPDGAVTAIYKLEGFLAQGGAINVFYDDLSFEYWQEETAWADDNDVHKFGKNWATYFTYNTEGLLPTISSDDLAGPFTAGVPGAFSVTTVNPSCGLAYSAVLFNYTIFDIVLSVDIASFEYFDGTSWHSLLLSMSQEGDDVTGYFGDLTAGFPMTAPYDAETKFKINITNSGTYTVEMTLDNLISPFEQLAFFTEDVVVLPETLAVGDNYGGGKVAYIFVEGDNGYVPGEQHGLIAAIADQSEGIIWALPAYQGTSVPGTLQTLGSGSANTDKIIAQNVAGTTYAAGLARAYTDGIYHDWFLPSKDELNKLYLKKGAIGGFADNYYWSSSENGANFAWPQYFYNGQDASAGKGYPARVRAVRAF